MIDLTQVQAAIASLSAVREIVKVGFDAKVDEKAAGKVIEAMDRLGQASDTLFKLREELLRLQAENADLRSASDDRKAFELRYAQYELMKTPGGAVVWRFKGDPEHYACPTCMNARRIEILQNNRTNSGKYRCVSKECGSEYPIEPREQRVKQAMVEGNHGPQGWMR